VCQDQNLSLLNEKAQELLENTDSWKLQTMSKDMSSFYAILRDIKSGLDDIKEFKSGLSKVQTCQDDLVKKLDNLQAPSQVPVASVRNSAAAAAMGASEASRDFTAASANNRGFSSIRGRGRSFRRGQMNPRGGRNLSNVQCFNCGGYGHVQSKCFYYDYQQPQFPMSGYARGTMPSQRYMTRVFPGPQTWQMPMRPPSYANYGNYYGDYQCQDPSLEWTPTPQLPLASGPRRGSAQGSSGSNAN